MTDEEYLILFEECQANTATPDERARFEAYLATAELPDLPWDETLMGSEASTQASILQRLQQTIPPPHPR